MRTSLIMMTLAIATASGAAFASDANRSILGGAIGGAAGAAIGHSVGGTDGAVIGGALGAATGVLVARPARREVVEKRVYVRDEPRRGFGPRHFRHHRGHGYDGYGYGRHDDRHGD